ncbi:MAG: endolytic transglycosylase MltG [bacterium]|nr:endolytic transglycosylase MltG [bacterium]
MEPHRPFHRWVRPQGIRIARVCVAWSREVRLHDRIVPMAVIGGALLFVTYLATLAAPLNFPSASLVKIPQGMTIGEAGQLLKEKNIIYSTLLFEAINKVEPGGGKIIAGEYFFSGPQNVFTVAWRLAQGDHELIAVKVRIPEGASAKEITQLLKQTIPDFDSTEFYTKALPKEGRLFPDTYFFTPGEDADLVLTAFQNNFNEHISDKTVADAIAKFGKPLEQVLTMASLLEKEAPDTKDRQIIAGILWKRLSINMPLQVDAVFQYIIGVNSLKLTKVQLQTDSPYNTYLHKGLPPGPIANPSIDAIVAAVTPTKTNYLYYLSDLHGTMHYCATYSCQQSNARKYLGN